MSIVRSEVDALYAVANDYESGVLDELRRKAGHTWDCYREDGSPHWTNDGRDHVCQECGAPRPVDE